MNVQAGDKLVFNQPNGQYYQLGEELIVLQVEGHEVRVARRYEGTNEARWYGIQNFRHEEKQTMQKDWREYTFNIKHTAQIDESQITEDLSWENPLFIMQVEGSDKIKPVVANEVWTKAAHSGKTADKDNWCETKFEKKLSKIIGPFGGLEIPMSDVPKLVKLIQKIKRAKWHDSQKRRVTVKRVQV